MAEASLHDLVGLGGAKALLVGGGAGMGLATARALAAAGCDLAVIDIDPEGARYITDIAAAYGKRGFAIAGDVTDHAALGGYIDQAHAALGGLDVIVTVVGQAHWKPLVDLTIEDWELDQNRNLRYVLGVLQAGARLMTNGGAITVIASVSGLQSAPNHAAYGAAKAGLYSLVKTGAVELASKGIRVNAIAPGATATPRVAAMLPKDEAGMKKEMARVPMGRIGHPDGIGKAALYLSSQLADYVSGQIIAVDGGMMAMFGFTPNV